MIKDQVRDEFFQRFESRILDIKYQTVPVPWQPGPDFWNQVSTEQVYVLEIPERKLASMLAWVKYMDRHFSPDPRQFFQRWWEAQTQEKDLREQHPAVKEAWSQYQTVLTLASTDPSALAPVADLAE